MGIALARFMKNSRRINSKGAEDGRRRKSRPYCNKTFRKWANIDTYIYGPIPDYPHKVFYVSSRDSLPKYMGWHLERPFHIPEARNAVLVSEIPKEINPGDTLMIECLDKEELDELFVMFNGLVTDYKVYFVYVKFCSLRYSKKSIEGWYLDSIYKPESTDYIWSNFKILVR